MLRITLATETIKPVSGKSTKETVKPSRGECRIVSGVPAVTCLRAFFNAREASVTGLDESIPFLRDPLAGDLLLSGIGTKAVT